MGHAASCFFGPAIPARGWTTRPSPLSGGGTGEARAPSNIARRRGRPGPRIPGTRARRTSRLAMWRERSQQLGAFFVPSRGNRQTALKSRNRRRRRARPRGSSHVALLHPPRRTLSRAVEMTLSAPSTPAFTGRPSLLRAAASARRARGPPPRRAGGCRREEGRQGEEQRFRSEASTSARVPSGSTRAGWARWRVEAGAQDHALQRTNKVYKTYLSGRPTVDDVERASQGDRTKAWCTSSARRRTG